MRTVAGSYDSAGRKVCMFALLLTMVSATPESTFEANLRTMEPKERDALIEASTHMTEAQKERFLAE